jgi:hypothetical protein
MQGEVEALSVWVRRGDRNSSCMCMCVSVCERASKREEERERCGYEDTG